MVQNICLVYLHCCLLATTYKKCIADLETKSWVSISMKSYVEQGLSTFIVFAFHFNQSITQLTDQENMTFGSTPNSSCIIESLSDAWPHQKLMKQNFRYVISFNVSFHYIQTLKAAWFKVTYLSEKLLPFYCNRGPHTLARDTQNALWYFEVEIIEKFFIVFWMIVKSKEFL